MKIIKSDITLETSGLIIHGTNTRGVMGAGAALAIRNRWPIVYEKFLERGKGKHLLGTLDIIKVADELYVGNLYSQEDYGRDGGRYADLSAIDVGLHKAFMWCYLNDMQLKSTMIGCQLGGLDWESEIKPLFLKYEDRFHDGKTSLEAEIYYI